MSRGCFLAIALFGVSSFGQLGVNSALPARLIGQYQLTEQARWIVYASRQDPDEAIGLARRFIKAQDRRVLCPPQMDGTP
jgi:hypothetical protein